MEVWKEAVSERWRKSGCLTTFQILGIKPTTCLKIRVYALLFLFVKLVLVGFCFIHSNNPSDTFFMILSKQLLITCWG